MSKKKDSNQSRALPNGLPISRRSVLRMAALGAAGAAVGGKALARDSLADPASCHALPLGKAKSVIQVWMWGGPCHIDTFDPKPEAGPDYTGPLDKPIATNVDGLRIGQLLPQLAKMADKYSILRSVTHGVNGHETASYMVQTGWKAGGRIVHPGVGAVVSKFKGYDAGYKGLIPPYIVLTRPQGRFSESGFLGSRNKPFATGGDPGAKEFRVEGISALGMTRERQKHRRELLRRLNTMARDRRGDPKLEEFFRAQEQAYDLILGDAGKVFDLGEEKQSVRDRYGRGTFAGSCLMARRLVEKGVPYVTINYRGWDTHKTHFRTMNQKLPELDRGLSALLQDLEERGLLESTIVLCGGEFGRTPKVLWNPPWNGGRSHYGRVFSYLVAGGGLRGGQVIGKSDERGERVVERPIYPWDLLSTLYAQLGIDPKSQLRHPQGYMVPLLPEKVEGYEGGGPLKELV